MYTQLLANNALSAFLGFISLAFLFFLCLFIVGGFKLFADYFRKKNSPPPPPPKEKPKPKRKRLRTVEINPDEVDRVYFKKIP